MSTFKIGCIADDFTGAGDAASFLAAGGMKTLMLIWPHVEAAVTDGYDAVVVALKSRSIPHDDPRNVIPSYTPYLEMKLGAVVEIPYAPPGSQELFPLMRERVGTERGYLLCNHGPIVAGRSLMNAFECLEELEQSSWLAWEAYSTGVQLRNL